MNYLERVRQRVSLLLGHHENVEIVINGLRLSPAQITAFKQLTGQPIPEPGHYWFDPATGNLGFVGSPVPYYNVYVSASPLAGRGGHAPSLSERRQLFNQADLTGLWIVNE